MQRYVVLVSFLMVLATATLSSTLVAQQEADPPTPPWRIEKVMKQGFAPDALRDKKGNVIFKGGKPIGIMDATGKTMMYSADASRRIVMEVPPRGKPRFWDRYLWVTVHFDQDAPQRLQDFVILDKDGQKMGRYHFSSQKGPGKKALPQKEVEKAPAKRTITLVFERDSFPDDAFKPVGWLEQNLVPAAPQERAAKEWQSLKGLYLSGMGHKAPLVAVKETKKKK